MIATCKAHLEQVLQVLGVKVFTEAEDQARHHALPYAVLVAGPGMLERDGGLVALEDDPATGDRTFRRRLYRQSLTVVVQLVARDEAALAQILERFVAGLGVRILDAAGNAIRVRPGQPAYTDDTSRLKQRAEVELQVEFAGGIYRDELIERVTLNTGLVVEPQVIQGA